MTLPHSSNGFKERKGESCPICTHRGRCKYSTEHGDDLVLCFRLSDEAVRAEYRQALAVLLPGEEDFGIVPVEAQACGRPVVAFARGGALETVIDGENGVLFAEADVASLAAALERVARQRFDSARISQYARRFSRDRHIQQMREVIDNTITAPADIRW